MKIEYPKTLYNKNDMKKRFEKFFGRHTRIVLQVSLVAVCIVAIVYFMPSSKYKSYSFEPDGVWEHEQIIADFDFIVKKSEKQISEEMDSIRRNTRPYFKLQEKQNEKELAGHLSSPAFKEYIDCLGMLYKDGVVSDNDASSLRSGKNKEIKIVAPGDTTIKDTRALTSVSEAFETLMSIDTLLTPRIADALGVKSHIKPNLVCDTALTRREIERQQNNLEKRIGVVLKGQRIINKGDRIDSKTFRALETYFAQLQEIDAADANKFNIFAGRAVFITLSMIILLIYIYIYRQDIADNSNKFIFTILSVTIFPILVGILLSHGGISVFVLPYAMVPMMLCLFLDQSIAFTAHSVTILMCSIMLGSPYEFLMLQTIAGICAILSLKELSSRSQMLRSAIIILLAYAISYMCYELIIESDFSKMKNYMYLYFTISATLMLFIYPMMLVIEKTFGFISNVTLIELSNLNSKLLQRMSQETPGTFQHSMQVGNLAAEAARALGANSLEVRTGALYHDIGKLNNPVYFTENQSGGVNPHNKLNPEESAAIIIKHVTDGLGIAEHEHLPRKIKEFIATHHGLSKTGYFYITYKNAHPDEEVDDKLFTYPGPKPTTQEQGILMLADCVEAASHSLKEYSDKNIEKLVDSIIDSKVSDGELEQTPLTFQDIYIIKNVFKKRLKAIYHTRISYPNEKRKHQA